MKTSIITRSLAVAVLAGSVLSVTADNTTENARRDPFWPVGYNPVESSHDQEPDIPQLEWPPLPVRGRARAGDGSFRALIQGAGVVETGETVSLFSQGHWFHWRIDAITPEEVRATPLGISLEPLPARILQERIPKQKNP